MRRRQILGVLGAVFAASAIASVAGAQQPGSKIPRIGLLVPPGGRGVEGVRQGLRELDYIEGENIAIDIPSAEGRLDRLRELATELVDRKVAVIVTFGPQMTQAAREATGTSPIVMGRMDDADARGFVRNYSRPEGNITGLSFQASELSTKWVELLKEVLPQGARIAALWDATNSVNQRRTIEDAARSLKVDLHTVEVRSPGEFAAAFAAMQESAAKGVVILASPLFTAKITQLAELAAAHRLAAIYTYRAFFEAGGLISYGPLDSDPSFTFRRAAYFVDKLLKGAKVADLPIEQPTRFSLAINLKTAGALSLEIPPSLLARADEVIE
jgi:putative tryptophan/tyrosine transport system substrate-binding protein